MRALMGLLLGLILIADGARADVLDNQPSGFTVSRRVSIAAPPAKVWAALGRIDAWWDSKHTYFGDARNLSLNLQPGAVFAETGPGGGAARHMVVVFVDPGKTLRLEGALGPLQTFGVTGSLTFSMKPDGAGTILVESYDVGGHAPGGLDKLATPVDGVMSHQVDRLVAYAEGRTPP